MNIAYISSSEFGCPAPANRIQAALWICQQVIEGMTKRGHHTIYIGAGDSTVGASETISMGPAFFDLYDYEEWVKLPSYDKDHLLSSYQAKLHLFLLDTLKKESVDIVHYHTSPPVFMLPYSRYVSTPKVITFHDPLPPFYAPIFRQYRDVDTNHYVSISEAQCRNISDVISSSTVYNGIPVEEYSFGQSPKNQLLFLGRMKQSKGVKEAIEVARIVDIPLVLAGRTAQTEKQFVESAVTPFIDGKKIRHVGIVGFGEKVKLLQESHVLLFPVQWDEPFGLVMIEAMICGTPVVAFNRGSVSEIVKDGATGFIIDPDNENRPGKGSWIIKKQGIEGLVEAIKRISEIDRAACRKHVEENFTVEKMVEGYEKVYQKVISQHKI